MKIPVLLSVFLYILIFFVRFQQDPFEPNLDLFPTIRANLDKQIQANLPSPQSDLLSGILLGQNRTLPAELKLALRDTSTLHIVVASGQNLSMVAGFFLGLAGLIKRKNAIVISLLASIFYTLLTGFQIPILRAAIMFSLASLAQLFGRKNDGSRVLVVTAGLLLLINPKWVFDLSFQLSFLATFGVIVVAPIFLEKLKFMPILGQDLAVSLAAQLMVMPIIAQNFHQISLVSLVTNVLILWTIPFIMVGGAVMLLLGLVLEPLGALIGIGVNVLLTYFIYIVQFFSSLPFAWEYIGEQIWVVWIGYYLVVAGILIMLSLNNDQTKVITRPAKGN